MARPKSLINLTPKQCKDIRGIFTDIDDTLSLNGKIPLSSYSALWRARASGLRIIPITGRPAGWVDHIARMWPVDAVIGENGAFYFYLDPKQGRDGKLVQRFLQSRSVREKNHKRLMAIYRNLRREMPDLSLASDQGYRAIDIAVDFCEDVQRLNNAKIDRIVEAFTDAGAQAKVSSIHVNAWYGAHDKFSTCKLLLKELYKESFDSVAQQYVYFGDSPNDEPLFREFPVTIGVANVREFLPRLKFKPSFITQREGGDGFAEAMNYILKRREA